MVYAPYSYGGSSYTKGDGVATIDFTNADLASADLSSWELTADTIVGQPPSTAA